MDYQTAVELLLNRVGQRVYVLICGRNESPPVAAELRGVLRQGRPDHTASTVLARGGKVDYFGIEGTNSGLYLVREAFESAELDDSGTLTLRFGSIEFTFV